MEYLIAIVLIVLVFKIFSKYFFIKDKSEIYDKKFPIKKITSDNFKLRPSLLNSNEHIFFNQLKLAVGNRYEIYPQVSLGAIFQPINQWHNWAEINSLNKRIDFVLFDKSTQTPKIAIELDGYSHSKYKNFKRDEFVESIFQKFKIPLLRFNNGKYSSEEIKKEIDNINF
ncbi:MAG: DUF2726 domain-containing protein [Bacteriovorax sp.]|nr:DUF2726 domain-containing protein [Bacteriovorax sp.]